MTCGESGIAEIFGLEVLRRFEGPQGASDAALYIDRIHVKKLLPELNRPKCPCGLHHLMY